MKNALNKALHKINMLIVGMATGLFVGLALFSFAGGTFDGLPPEFADITRTNTMTWDARSSTKPLAAKVTILGTTYTGVTTNYLLGGTNWNFVGGILVQ